MVVKAANYIYVPKVLALMTVKYNNNKANKLIT